MSRRRTDDLVRARLSLYFSLFTGIEARENSSLQTAYAATQSSLFSEFHRIAEKAHFSAQTGQFRDFKVSRRECNEGIVAKASRFSPHAAPRCTFEKSYCIQNSPQCIFQAWVRLTVCVEGAFLPMTTVWPQPLKLGICDPHCRA